jgi:hypothetical protein
MVSSGAIRDGKTMVAVLLEAERRDQSNSASTDR